MAEILKTLDITKFSYQCGVSPNTLRLIRKGGHVTMETMKKVEDTFIVQSVMQLSALGVKPLPKLPKTIKLETKQ